MTRKERFERTDLDYLSEFYRRPVRQGLGQPFANHFPTTGEVIGEVSAAGKAEVDAAVEAARAALKGPCGRMPVAERVSLLRKVANGINARSDEFLAAEIRDPGKPRAIASHIVIPRGAANFNVFSDLIVSASTEAFEMATPDGRGALNYALRMPRGVIGVVCPWNLPLLLMTWKVAPALACGNTVVVKPSEETPATATLLGEVMNAGIIFDDADLEATLEGIGRACFAKSGCPGHRICGGASGLE